MALRGADGQDRARACLVRHHRPPHRGPGTKGDIERWAAGGARCAAGASCGNIIINSHGYGLFTRPGAHYGGEALGATVIPMGGGSTESRSSSSRSSAPR